MSRSIIAEDRSRSRTRCRIIVRRMAAAGASNLAYGPRYQKEAQHRVQWAYRLRRPLAMRSSTAPCKLPASSSWTVSHDRVYDASQAYGCFCEHSAQGSCVCAIKESHTSFAFPFPLSFLPRSIAFPLPFPLLFALGSKSSKISRSESESPSCSMRLGGMLDNDWKQRESDAHVQRGCVWRAMSHTNPRLLVLEQRALVFGTRRPRARCTRRSITPAAVAVCRSFSQRKVNVQLF